MDGLEISCPVDVSVPAKLMGSEGCGGGVRVSSNKADNKTRVSIGDNSSIERCTASINNKGAGSSSGAADSSLWRKLMHSHDFVHDRLTKLRVENSSEPQNVFSPIVGPESAESPRKRGKLSRSSSNGTSRRTKLILLDNTVNIPRDNDTKEICRTTTHLEKPLVVKQRTSCNGKRGDKRISKVPVRTFSNINIATGENAFFGTYGLKPAINDVTKLVEDLSLKNLLEGSYECPLGKDKVEKSENTNDALLSVVRNVWSILSTKAPVQSQNSTELDTRLSRTVGSPTSSVSPTLTNGENMDKVNALHEDLSSSSMDLCINSEIPSAPLSFPLCDAGDILRRLGLPPSRDLDSLLQDAPKPSQNSKNNLDQQQRSAKQLPPRSGMPHFPWSQAFNGNSRTNTEAAKLVTSKTLCQGRWLRIADTTTSSPEGINENFANLESLTFNQNLVPPPLKQTVAETKTSQTISATTTLCQCTEASLLTRQKASFVPKEPERTRDVKNGALPCPQLLAAAQTLCDLAVQSANHNNPNEILSCRKKHSQKSMKARKAKLIEKPLERHGITVSSLDLNSSSNNNNNKNHVRKELVAEHNNHHHPKPSKRLKLSTMENKKGSDPTSSSSSLPIESDRKHSSSSKFKNHSRLMPPPPPPKRPLQKASTYPQKSRKFL